MLSAIVLASQPTVDGEFAPLQPVYGQSAVEATVQHLLRSPVHEIIVVTGYQRRVIERLLARRPCRFVLDQRWAQGDTLSAVAAGLRTVHPQSPAALICAAGAPSPQIEHLIERWQAGDEEHLYALRGDAGAMMVLAPRAVWGWLAPIAEPRTLDDVLTQHADSAHWVQV